VCARDADKLEMLLQAIEYRDIGIQRVDGWIDTARKDLKTETAQRIADAAITLSPRPGATADASSPTSAPPQDARSSERPLAACLAEMRLASFELRVRMAADRSGVLQDSFGQERVVEAGVDRGTRNQEFGELSGGLGDVRIGERLSQAGRGAGEAQRCAC
jgi:hypothetical protein